MSVSFIDQFKKLQKLINDDNYSHQGQNSAPPQRSSVRLMAKLIENEISQKKNLGIFPRRRFID